MKYTSKKTGYTYELAESTVTLRGGKKANIQYFVHPGLPPKKGRKYADKLKKGFVIKENNSGFPMVVKEVHE